LTTGAIKVLERIKVSGDVKGIEKENIAALCQEIRDMLVNVVTVNGGHLASNLGVVELTVALHRCFDLEKDSIIFDVGHQSYVHKILTGRKDLMNTMGKPGGLNCFPDEAESKYDAFNTGHASTSISAALGMEKAGKLLGSDGATVVVIGDGALAGGMVYEALNNAADDDSDILIILNDNEMSISRNVGAMSRYLSKLRLKRSYIETNTNVKKLVSKLPGGGKGLIRFVQKTKRGLKSFVGQKMFFEDLDIKYLGPVDGHDEEEIEDILNRAKNVKGPKLLHVITTKGKGYTKAENDPVMFHGIKSSASLGKHRTNPTYAEEAGKALIKLAGKDDKVVCVCPAMTEGSGLQEFNKTYKDRYFDVGITEQHAITFAAGMAKNGIKPVAVIYSSFLQRAYDQILHDVCLTGRKVVICVDKSGINERYGKTHQGIYDLSFLSSMPNMAILAPGSKEDVYKLIRCALYDISGCVAVRYPSDEIMDFKNCTGSEDDYVLAPVEYNAGGERKDTAILAYGRMLNIAMQAASECGCAVIKIRKLYPLDHEKLYEMLKNYRRVFCAEDVIYNGSVTQNIESWMYRQNIKDFVFKGINIKENASMQGSVGEILSDNGLSSDILADMITNDKA
jgi:1-deoxy-D-xylulose-5-phosphate synthase